MSFGLTNLAVNLAIAGAPFSPRPVENMQAAGIYTTEFPLNKTYINYDDPGAVADAARRLHSGGIRVWSCHPPFGGEWDISQLDDARRRRAVELTIATFPATQAIAAGLIIIHPSAEPIPDAERAARIEQARRSLRELAAAAAPFGLRLAVEILPRTCLGRTSEELMSIIGDSDERLVGACLDANHANLREELPHTVKTLGRRLLTLHISDNDGVDERHWLPGKGVIRWREFLQVLSEHGYGGAFVYETAPLKGDEVKGLKEVRENFQRLLDDTT